MRNAETSLLASSIRQPTTSPQHRRTYAAFAANLSYSARSGWYVSGSPATFGTRVMSCRDRGKFGITDLG